MEISSPPSPPASMPGRVANIPWGALSVLFTGTFMAILDVFIVLVATPAIQVGLHASHAETELVLAVYQLTYAVTLITAGRLGDMYGRRRLFVAGMALFTLASLACGCAPTAVSLIVFRAIQGIGAAALFPQVFASVAVLVPSARRGRVFGVLGAVIGASTVVGQVLGGALIEGDIAGSGWRPIFWINVPIGVIACLLAVTMVPDTRSGTTTRLDPPGLLTLTMALGLLVLPLVEGRELGWPLWTWLSIAAAVALLAAFVWTQHRAARSARRDPLVRLQMFTQRPFAVGILLVLVYYSALNSFFLIMSVTLQDGLGYSPLQAGLIYAPQAVIFLVTSLLAGRASKQLRGPVLLAGAVLAGIGFAATVIVGLRGGHLDAANLIPALLIQGVGEGLLQTPLINSVLDKIPADDTGVASGILSTAQQIGGAIGVAVVGIIFFAALGSPPAHYPGALAAATIYNTCALTCCAALVVVLIRTGTVRS